MPEIISMAYKAVAAATQRAESIENLMEPEEPAILD